LNGEEYELEKCPFVMIFPAVVNSYNSNREYKNREKKTKFYFHYGLRPSDMIL